MIRLSEAVVKRPKNRPLFRKVIPEVCPRKTERGLAVDLIYPDGCEDYYNPDLVGNAILVAYRCGCGRCNCCLIKGALVKSEGA